MKTKTTREMSTEQESFVEEIFSFANARRSPSSGSSFSDPNDVTSDYHVIECKCTEGETITISRSDWLKIRKKAYNGRQPAMAFRFRDPYDGKNIDLLLQEIDEAAWQIEEVSRNL